jgi:CRISPR-associated protein Csd1
MKPLSSLSLRVLFSITRKLGLRESSGKKKSPKPMQVPNIGKQALKHNNSGKDANLLWDNASFVLGLGDKGQLRLESMVQAIDQWLSASDDVGTAAVRKFFMRGIVSRESFAPILTHEAHREVLSAGAARVSFRVTDTPHRIVFESPLVKRALVGADSDTAETSKIPKGICLVTGEENVPIELTHTVIKGVWRAQPSGACIVSFNKDKPAFESFGKEQSHNAPVSKQAASQYVKGLNYLLESDQCVHIADASTVFWSEKKTSFESDFSLFFSEPPKDDPGVGTRAVKALFESPKTGAYFEDDGQTRFYVLGLAPNAARISVRFWKQGTVREVGNKIRSHFHDLEIQLNRVENSWDWRAKKNAQYEYFGLHCLLTSIVREYKTANIPPNIAGAVIQSVLNGTPYPRTLMQQCMRRIRAEQAVTRERVAILKACINRQFRNNQHKTLKEVQVALDQTNKDPEYLLGRLFAVFEKVQEEAQGKASIRERFYGAASSAPATIFPTLFKLKNHHLAKLNSPGRKVNLEKLVGSIVDGLEAKPVPPHLTLDEQALFAVGYYHQRQDLFAA